MIKDRINSNKSNVVIVVGLLNPNETQFFGCGKLSDNSNANVDLNTTIFLIGSTIKVFTTILLADMVKEDLIIINDTIKVFTYPKSMFPLSRCIK
ncbi:MAG TPA: hypothetical protein VFG45_07460 [Candidatus Nitrosocosmicus sp.]|nr:hypothetical protein [Candidatus Nitrosocosmicus sp.]